MTLGPIVLRAAKKVVVMISGQEKRETLAALVNEPPDPTRYFVQLLWLILDWVTGFIGSAVASRFFRDADETV
jgi:6-phosphogluconolactonase/glucosamine-6-phosphate isomerase/deaminase